MSSSLRLFVRKSKSTQEIITRFLADASPPQSYPSPSPIVGQSAERPVLAMNDHYYVTADGEMKWWSDEGRLRWMASQTQSDEVPVPVELSPHVDFPKPVRLVRLLELYYIRGVKWWLVHGVEPHE